MHRRHRFLIALSMLVAAALGLAVLASVPQRTAARPVQQRVVREALFQPVDHFGGAITGVAVAGNYAYIDRGLRLEVLDMTDPLVPQTIGRSAPLPGLAQVAAVSDGQVYLVERVRSAAVREDRLYIVDVTDPAAPRLRGRLDLGSGSLLAVVLRDGLLYSAGANSGVLVLDVRDPDQPRYLTTVATDLPAKGAAVNGDRLLVAVSPGARGDKALQLRHREPTIGAPTGIASDGIHAYVSDDDSEVWVLDLRDPAAPAMVGRAELENGKAGAQGKKRAALGAAGLTFRNDIVYVACNDSWAGSNGLHVVDVSDPRVPRQVGFWDRDLELARHPELVNQPLALNGYPPALSGDRLWFTGAPC